MALIVAIGCGESHPHASSIDAAPADALVADAALVLEETHSGTRLKVHWAVYAVEVVDP